jgi:aspartate racemase
MTKHIGIAACSAEGAALCYRTICIEGAEYMGKHNHPEVTMHTYPLAAYMEFIDKSDWQGVAQLMLSSAKNVAKCGADFIICPDNTIHQAFDKVVEKSPLPWLHIAEEIAKEAKQNDHNFLGILGTRFLMEGPVYAERLAEFDITFTIPEKDDREHINTIIFDELVNNIFTEESRNYFIEVIHKMQKLSVDAVVLGCTEIPLLISQEHSPLPILDSTRILARAALKNAIKE